MVRWSHTREVGLENVQRWRGRRLVSILPPADHQLCAGISCHDYANTLWCRHVEA